MEHEEPVTKMGKTRGGERKQNKKKKEEEEKKKWGKKKEKENSVNFTGKSSINCNGKSRDVRV